MFLGTHVLCPQRQAGNGLKDHPDAGPHRGRLNSCLYCNGSTKAAGAEEEGRRGAGAALKLIPRTEQSGEWVFHFQAVLSVNWCGILVYTSIGKLATHMVLRSRDTRRMLYAVYDSYERVFPKGEERAELLRNIRLLENGDLYINDDYDPEIIGIFLKAMRAHGFLQEDAEKMRMNLSQGKIGICGGNMEFSKDDLKEAKCQIDSTLHKLREVIITLESKDNPQKYKSQITLAKRRVKAFEIANQLIDNQFEE